MKRHNLAATETGRARTLPRATVEALVARASQGVSPETANHYLRAVRGFFRWMVRSKRLTANPLETLARVNSQVDVRRARRELTAEELRTVLETARASARSFRGLSGLDRYHLSLLAAGTGFRAAALASLTPNDFDLNGEAPTVTLAARFNKRRKPKIQPFAAEVADAIRASLAASRPGTESGVGRGHEITAAPRCYGLT